MATLADIKSPVWTYSLTGGIAEGLAAIRQCIDVIIRTTKGTDPLRPEFGSDLYRYIGYPVNVAIPNIKKAMLTAIELWEQRVIVTSITHTIDLGNLLFNINYRLADGTLTDSLLVTVNNGGVYTGVTGNRLILQGYFPPNPAGYQYSLSAQLDGEDILPVPPIGGFTTAAEMLAWVQTNWGAYGQWYIASDSIIGYIADGYKTGKISIAVMVVKRFQGAVPVLAVGLKYGVSIVIDGNTVENDVDLYTPSQLLNWVQNNDALNVGTWQLLQLPGAFNDDFNDDFQLFSQALAIDTALAKVITITITAE